MSRNTFTAERENRRRQAIGNLDDGAIWAIRCTPDPVRNEEAGTTSIGMSFPVPYLTGWVSDPQAIAEKIADLLTEAQL